MPAVSVLMPCYNAAGTLEEALDSLKRQSLDDFEVVAVDDGSSDPTRQILESWGMQDGRIRLLSLPHEGIVGALNAGLAVCQSPYVARMDADDRAHPERLSRQVKFLDQHPEVSVAGCLVSGFSQGRLQDGYRLYIDWLNSLVTNADIRREIFVESPFAHPSVIFHREAVLQAGGYQDHGWPEDYDLWLRLFLAGASFAKIPEFLLDWRDGDQRLTRIDSRYSLENFLRLKAFYLARGPLMDREAVIVWGAGMMGKRLSRHLLREGIPLVAFADIDPRKIGHTRRGIPVLSPQELLVWWDRYANPVLLVAVGTRGARPLIRERLSAMGLREAQDWWFAA